jgi:beta-glucosidase
MQCGGWTIEWQGNTGPIQPGTTILEGIQQGFSDETRVEYRPQGDFEGMAEVGVAVVGERPYAEGVGDAAVLALAEQDLQTLQNLRAHSARVVAIILSGRPLVITDQLDSADVWIAAWLPGTEGAGVADVLFGDDAFTGRLPFPWPRTNDQLPLTEASTAGTPECAAPLFPVGFGAEDAHGRPVALPSCP